MEQARNNWISSSFQAPLELWIYFWNHLHFIIIVLTFGFKTHSFRFDSLEESLKNLGPVENLYLNSVNCQIISDNFLKT